MYIEIYIYRERERYDYIYIYIYMYISTYVFECEDASKGQPPPESCPLGSAPGSSASYLLGRFRAFRVCRVFRA